jgi:hypothetical protein
MVTVVARIKGNRISAKPSVTEYKIDIVVSSMLHVLLSCRLGNGHVCFSQTDVIGSFAVACRLHAAMCLTIIIDLLGRPYKAQRYFFIKCELAQTQTAVVFRYIDG